MARIPPIGAPVQLIANGVHAVVERYWANAVLQCDEFESVEDVLREQNSDCRKISGPRSRRKSESGEFTNAFRINTSRDAGRGRSLAHRSDSRSGDQPLQGPTFGKL